MEEKLTRELKAFLKDRGASLAGVGDLTGIAGHDYRCGVSVAVKIPPSVVEVLLEAPDKNYYDTYYRLNALLDSIVTAGEQYLMQQGYRACALTVERVKRTGEERVLLPHKTAAVHAGLGWVGKSDLLVTPQFGSAVRLSTLLTDAPLICDKPELYSRCGGCMECSRACPGEAIYGRNWEMGMDRDDLIHMPKCRSTAKRITKERFGIEATICGKCFAVCPYTKKYLREEKTCVL